MIHRLTWLHCSDFHFVATGDDFSQREATRALLQDAATRTEGGPPIAFVLVTGDVAFSGQPDQYVRAGNFLSELAATLGVSPERFFFVPGNHDVDRSRHSLAFDGACQRLTTQADVDRILGHPDDVGALLNRQAAFWDFVHDFVRGQDSTATEDGLGYVASLVVDRLRLCIIGLNSAWLSGRNAEEMRLLIGERQIINALRVVEDSRPHLLLAMAHHPISWLQEWDQLSCHHRLLPEVEFYHRGHLHQEEVSLTSSPDRPCLAIAAGSSHATRFYANSYNLVALDLGTGVCTVRPFRYDPTAARFDEVREITSLVRLRGSLPGTLRDLAEVMSASVPRASPYAGYMAALISGYQGEIPVRVDDTIHFLTPTASNELAAPEELTEAMGFLSLQNLLRLYEDHVQLPERIAEHAAAIEGFADRLARLAVADDDVREQLAGRNTSGLRVVGISTGSRRPYASVYLLDLRAGGDWDVLELQARRFVESDDLALARTAKACLVEALMHSDETVKREEGARLAGELLEREDVTANDYLLAAAALEVVGEAATAVGITKRALELWPEHSDLHSFARGLASRTGDVDLRGRIDLAREQAR